MTHDNGYTDRDGRTYRFPAWVYLAGGAAIVGVKVAWYAHVGTMLWHHLP